MIDLEAAVHEAFTAALAGGVHQGGVVCPNCMPKEVRRAVRALARGHRIEIRRLVRQKSLMKDQIAALAAVLDATANLLDKVAEVHPVLESCHQNAATLRDLATSNRESVGR